MQRWERDLAGVLNERRLCVCGAPVLIPHAEHGPGVVLVRTNGREAPVRFVAWSVDEYVTESGARFRRRIGLCSYRVGSVGPLTPVIGEEETAVLETWAKGASGDE